MQSATQQEEGMLSLSGLLTKGMDLLSKSDVIVNQVWDCVNLQSVDALVTKLEQVVLTFGFEQEEEAVQLRNGDGIDRINTILPDALLANICDYLNLNDMGSVMQTCSHLNSTIHPLSSKAHMFWSREWKMWCEEDEKHLCHYIYISRRLQYERSELKYWNSTLQLMVALKKIDSFVIDVSGNVGRFPSHQIAEAVSRRRPQALAGAIVDNVEIARHFRKVTRYNNAVSFMSTQSFGTGASRPPITAKGFVGYALDLLELRPEEEYLREGVLASLVYRDLTVWENIEDAHTAIISGQYASAQPFYCVLNDQRNDLTVMDDDAPRNVLGNAPPRQNLVDPSAPWKHFRPHLRDVKSPTLYVQQLQNRVRAFEAAMLASAI
jgi:hypothetical protein